MKSATARVGARRLTICCLLCAPIAVAGDDVGGVTTPLGDVLRDPAATSSPWQLDSSVSLASPVGGLSTPASLAGNAGRYGGELGLSETVRLEVGVSDVAINRGNGLHGAGTFSVSGLDRAPGSQLADATLLFDAARMGRLSVQAIGGARSMLIESSTSGALGSSALGVGGVGLSLALSDAFRLKGRAVSSAEESLGVTPYIESRLGAAVRTLGGGELSIGWEYLAGSLPVLDRRGEIRRDAIVFEFRIGF